MLLIAKQLFNPENVIAYSIIKKSKMHATI